MTAPAGSAQGTLDDRLDELDACYERLLGFTPAGVHLGSDPDACASFHDRFVADGYVRLPDMVPQDALERLAELLWPVLSPLSFPVVVPHTVRDGALTSGGRLRRVDGRSLEGAQGAQVDAVLQAVGLVAFGTLLAERLAPVLDRVVGRLRYERLFTNLYLEGDYLTAHDDAHMQDRHDVNLSVTLDGACGLRVLVDGMLETQPDGGAIGVLGPRTWHEVPVLLRRPDGPAPRRLTFTLRYWPA